MCGRYYIDSESMAFMELTAQIANGPDGARLMDMRMGEVFPSHVAPVLAERPRLMQWGFSRYDGGGKVINARSETALEKPMFHKSMEERRCLIPASYYFEWQRNGSAKKEKYAFALPNGRPFYMAGVFRQEKELPLPVFVILTRQAALPIAHIHDRMPVILPEESQGAWLSPNCNVHAILQTAIKELSYHPAV